MGIPEEGGLRYIGRVGSGFTDKELDALASRLSRMERVTSPFVDLPNDVAASAHFITPKLVGEVSFSEWTGSGNLRHPVWKGWRTDKTVDDVVAES